MLTRGFSIDIYKRSLNADISSFDFSRNVETRMRLFLWFSNTVQVGIHTWKSKQLRQVACFLGHDSWSPKLQIDPHFSKTWEFSVHWPFEQGKEAASMETERGSHLLREVLDNWKERKIFVSNMYKLHYPKNAPAVLRFPKKVRARASIPDTRCAKAGHLYSLF